MKGDRVNIKFEYRYRDYGNFKNYNSVVFRNGDSLPVEEIDRIISRELLNDRTFEASRLNLPELFFKNFPYDPELDWPMHEYCGVAETNSPQDDAQGRDIRDLVSAMGESCG